MLKPQIYRSTGSLADLFFPFVILLGNVVCAFYVWILQCEWDSPFYTMKGRWKNVRMKKRRTLREYRDEVVNQQLQTAVLEMRGWMKRDNSLIPCPHQRSHNPVVLNVLEIGIDEHSYALREGNGMNSHRRTETHLEALSFSVPWCRFGFSMESRRFRSPSCKSQTERESGLCFVAFPF